MQARPVQLNDLPVFERLWGDERVGRTLGGPRSGADVQAALESAVEHWSQHGYGRWLLHEDGQPVGTVKLASCEVAVNSEVELGYALPPERWGVGYATEAAAGALGYGRDVTQLREIVAFALVSNTASFAVLQRLRFRYEHDFEAPAGRHALHRLEVA